MIEKEIKSFRKEIMEMKNKSTAGLLLDYDEALEEVRKRLSERIKEEESEKIGNEEEQKEVVVKNKKYLRDKIQEYFESLKEIININNIRVKGFEEEKINIFIKEAADEFIGFDILAEAYENPKVSDIYVITWDNIYIEEDGQNREYHKKFRSPLHFKSFLFRLLNESGVELNNGDAKKADFELYGDRYCATSPAISPKGYSLSIRKHAEEHIKFEDLLKGKLLNDEMAKFMGLLIKGERNIIYAGITGSGKTTSIRAFLDYFVPKLNKRMLVCEDTQELFPENKHTLELVSSLTKDPKTEVTLQQLVYTALRLKPKYIIIGEIRGEEAQAASEAMETGHSTIATMHGGKAINCINRIVTKYLTAMPSLGIEVVERIIGSSIDYIFIQDNIPDIGRRITEVTEISYDYEKRTVKLRLIYKFDVKTQEFIRVNDIDEEKVDLMLRKGVKYREIHPWV